MSRSVVPAVSLALLLMLAGCSGGVGPTETAGSPTATEGATASNTDGAIDSGGTYRPTWLNGTGIDGRDLLFAHARAVNRSDGYRIEFQQTVRNSSVTRERTVLVEGSRSQRRFRSSDRRTTTDGTETNRWLDGRYVTRHSVFVRATIPGVDEVAYSQKDAGARQVEIEFRSGTFGVRGTTSFDVFRFDYDGTVYRDGRTLHRFRATAFNDERDTPKHWTNPNATVLLDENRIIREFRLRMTDPDGEWSSRSVMRTRKVGDVTVREPDWIDRARDQTSD